MSVVNTTQYSTCILILVVFLKALLTALEIIQCCSDDDVPVDFPEEPVLSHWQMR